MTAPMAAPEACSAPAGARAFLAFQIADHWGNRWTPRPSPRADVLAAVLWVPFSDVTLPGRDAATPGLYPELLVAELALTRAEQAQPTGDLSLLHHRIGALRAALLDEPAYRQVLLTGAHHANLAMVTIWGRLAEVLLGGAGRPTRLPGLLRDDATTELEVRPAGPMVYRLHPWPLVGRRLDIHADLPHGTAGTTRRVWTLLPTGAEVD